MGLKQIFSSLTRGKHLLDPALTGSVLAAVTDHKLLQVSLNLPVVDEISFQRDIWLFQDADWDRMQDDLSVAD